MLAAAVDQHHPDAHHAQGGHVLEGGVGGRLRPQGGAAVFHHNGPALVPLEDGQNGQQGAHLLHAVQAVAHVVLLKKGLDIVHVRGGVDILGAPLLAGLRPLAGDEEDGGLPAAQHRLADGLPPVGLDGVVAALGLHIGGDLPADGEGVLLPGVLLRQHHQVGAAAGDLPQVPPAVQGLFPRTAEHGDHPAAGVLRLNGAEQGLEGHAVVGVVHDGHDVAVRIGVHLHAAGDPGLHQPHIDGPLRDVQPLAHRDGGQGVLHVEQAGHGQPELPGKAAGTHPEQDVVAPLAHLGGIDVRLRVLLGEGDDLAAARLGGGQHPAGVFAVQIDAPHLRLGEDPQLGGEVVLKVGVLDGGDVVQADVQEAGGGEAGAQGAVVLQRLAGHLHGEVGDAGRHRVGKVPLEIQGLRRGEVGLEALRAVVGVDGGDDAALRPALLRQILIQDILQIIGGGGLALGAGDADDRQGPGGMAVVPVGQGGHHLAHVGHQDAGQIHGRVGGLAHIGHRAPLGGLGQIGLLEVGALAQKESAGDHLLAVAGDQGDGLGQVQPLGQRSGQLGLQQGAVFAQGVGREIHRANLLVLSCVDGGATPIFNLRSTFQRRAWAGTAPEMFS